MDQNRGIPAAMDELYEHAVSAAVRTNIPYSLSRPTVPVRFPPCGRTSRPACHFDTDRVETDETNAPTVRGS